MKTEDEHMLILFCTLMQIGQVVHLIDAPLQVIVCILVVTLYLGRC